MIIHQVYELWFKQILHEAVLLQSRLEDGNSAGALHTARRIAKILKTIVGQLDVLETMTPKQFASFRPELGSARGSSPTSSACSKRSSADATSVTRTATPSWRAHCTAARCSTHCCAISPHG